MRIKRAEKPASPAAIDFAGDAISLPLPLLKHPLLLPKVAVLGQVFTPQNVIDEMLSLRRNRGAVLEPSCGDGAFLARLGNRATGIEIDPTLPQRRNVIQGDFFAHSVRHQYPSIIGNPPYVRYQDILPQTKALLSMELFDKRSNLYLFFIEKCIRHLPEGGELIFITPRDFLKATSARKLNRLLYEKGSFTHYRELGDAAVFKGYTPNCAIWRWEKGATCRITAQGDTFHCHQGQLWFGDDNAACETLSTLFDVKVGAVSGADHLFASPRHGNVDMVCSSTVRDGATRRMIYNEKHPSLDKHKAALLARKIRAFNEANWWEWDANTTTAPCRACMSTAKRARGNPFSCTRRPPTMARCWR